MMAYVSNGFKADMSAYAASMPECANSVITLCGSSAVALISAFSIIGVIIICGIGLLRLRHGNRNICQRTC